MRATTATLIILVLFITGCVPPHTVIKTKEENNVNSFNEELENKKVEITLINDKKLQGKKAHLESDTLFYTTSSHPSAVSLSDIKYVTVSPKFSPITFQTILMVGGGIFCLTTVGSSSFGPGFAKMTIGIVAIGLGTIYYLTWAPEESTIYYFNE